jgi:hypothetical protein
MFRPTPVTWPISHLIGVDGFMPDVDRRVLQSEYSLASSAKVKWSGATPPLPLMLSWRMVNILPLLQWSHLWRSAKTKRGART